MEVSFCTTGLENGEVDLWYGTDPKRKKLVLAPAGAAAKCDTVYFAPQDACFGDLAGLDPACVNKCGAAGQACGQFNQASLFLTVSYCQPTGSVVNGTVQRRSVTYLENNCRCLDDTSCMVGARTQCHATGLPNVRVCALP